MKTWIYSLITLLSISVILSSCRKSLHEDLNPEKLSDVKIPDGFTWESSRDISFKVDVSDDAEPNGIYVVAIYTADGKLLSKGAASVGKAFESKIYLPADVAEVYVLKTNSDNSVDSKKVEIKSSNISVSFAKASSISSTKGLVNTLASGSPDCNTGCTSNVVITQDDQVVIGGGTVCVSGSNKRFSIKFNQGTAGTVRICGTGLTLTNLNFVQDGLSKSIIVTENGSVTFDNVVASTGDFAYVALYNYGSLTIKNGKYGYFINHGTLDASATSYIFDSFTNNGTATVNGFLGITGRGRYINNNGSLTVNGDLQLDALSAGNTFRNYCKTIVTGKLIVQGGGSFGSGEVQNYGYINVGDELKIYLGGYFSQYPSAMVNTKNLNIASGIARGFDGSSLIKVSANSYIGRYSYYPNATVSGMLKICDTNGIEYNQGNVSSDVKFDCDINIPVNACNPVGNGTMASSDSDGDGIADNIDDYPNDATKAFNNPYPVGDASAGATVLFEDMWPSKGDYDLNDVVLSYNLKIITNAQNKVSAVDGTYSLRARGGIFENGFGIEFPIDRTKISDVIGGTLEAGQQKAVIVLFNNMLQELGQMNTRAGDPVANPKVYSFSFKITDGPALTTFGLGEYNPFIWDRSRGRGYEIHLPGKTPTSLANTALFGTGDDGTTPSAGKYYVTKDGFPYAISIPVKDFAYPVEGKDIGTAYLKLAQWVASGGSSYTDWYSNQASGYRNTTNLFIK